MGYFVTVVVIALGLAADLIIEISAEVSTDVLIEAEAGVEGYGTVVVSDRIIDTRPETALATNPRLGL